MLQGRFLTAWYLQNTLIFSSSDPACDVHLLITIQLGVTYGDENGRRPQGKCFLAIQSFDDVYAPNSFELLKTSGINFKRHEAQGIDPEGRYSKETQTNKQSSQHKLKQKEQQKGSLLDLSTWKTKGRLNINRWRIIRDRGFMIKNRLIRLKMKGKRRRKKKTEEPPKKRVNPARSTKTTTQKEKPQDAQTPPKKKLRPIKTAALIPPLTSTS
ncbi:hypothetical protein MJO29_008524, partial [Puccinia striiformis f. sp. tritici]